MKNSRTDIDNLFEQGVSNVSRAPRKTLSDEQIKAAAAASKSGAGIWLLSHAKEMLIGVVSFVAGCLVMIAVLHYAAPKPSDSQVGTDMTDKTDVAVVDNELDNDLDNDLDLNQHGQNEQTSQLQNPEYQVHSPKSQVHSPKSQAQSPKSQVQSPKSQVQSPKSQEEPVVVKKTIVQRDTVVINETVIFKDTVYVP